MRNRVLSLCMILVLCYSLFLIPALATEDLGVSVDAELVAGEYAEEYAPVMDWDESFNPDGEIFPETAILMDADEQDVYEELKRSMFSQLVAFYSGDLDCVTLTAQAASRDDALNLFNMVRATMPNDFPEAFYYLFSLGWSIRLSSEDETNWTISFTPIGAHWDLLLDAVSFYSAVDQACLECFGSADAKNVSMTDFEKIVSAHDWLSACCRYDPSISNGLKYGSASWTAPDGNVHTYYGKQGAYPALVWRNAECGGYAKAFKVLMDRVGINCYIASGKNPTTGSTHAWNVVELNGNWYHVDCTWDSFSAVNVYDYAGRINRNWLLVSDEERAKSGYEWRTEYDIHCPSSYTLPDVLKSAGNTPVFFSNGRFYLTNKDGKLLQYETGSDFASGRELIDLGFSPRTGVCDRQRNTLYYTRESAENPVSIWHFSPDESDAVVTKFDEVGDYTACGLYADAIGNGQTMLRAVYCYQTVKSWKLGDSGGDDMPPIFFGGSGTEDDPYQISDKADLQKFAELINVCNPDYAGAHYILTADIDLNGIDDTGNGIAENAWTTIGKTAEGVLSAFKGCFDGQGHTIRGMYVQGGNYIGLFSGISGGEIKNLNVSGIVEGGSYVGGLCGCGAGAITNCSCDVRITAGGSYVGGIAGYNYLHPMESCTSSGSIHADGGYVGGIVGYSENSKAGFPNHLNIGYEYLSANGTITKSRNGSDISAKDSYTGGIAGFNNEGVMTKCYNDGCVSGNAQHTGGLVGYDNKGTMTKCDNYGSIIGTNHFTGGLVGYNGEGAMSDCYNFGNVTGKAHYTGGLAGHCQKAVISRSVNAGIVYGNNRADSYGIGGLAGRICESNITDCYNTGMVVGLCNVVGGLFGYQYAGVAERCYNTGHVRGNAYVGGLLGLAPANETCGYIRNCYNTSPVTGQSVYVGGIIGSILGNFSVEFSYSVGEVTGKNYLGGVVGSTVDLGSIANCCFLESSDASIVLDSIGLNDGGSIDSDTGPMTESEFADWSKFKLWDNNLWMIESSLALSNSRITTRPILRSIGEHEGQLSSTPQVILVIQNENDSTVSVDLICPNTDAAVFCGVYDSNGRMIAIRSAHVTNKTNYQFQFIGQQFDCAKVFILDSNFCPLCEAQRT